MAYMVEYCASSRQMHQLSSVPVEDSCHTFIKALHETARRMVPPLSSAMVLDVYFATMVLTMVRPFSNASESSRVINLPAHLVYQPMLLVIKTSRFTLNDLCDHVRNIGRYDQRCSRLLCSPLEAASLLPICSSNLLVEELNKFIGRVEVKWCLDGPGL